MQAKKVDKNGVFPEKMSFLSCLSSSLSSWELFQTWLKRKGCFDFVPLVCLAVNSLKTSTNQLHGAVRACPMLMADF